MVVPFQEEAEVHKTYSKKLSDIISANEIPIDKKVKLYAQTKEKHKNSPILIKENPETVLVNIKQEETVPLDIKQKDFQEDFQETYDNQFENIDLEAIIEKKLQEVLKKNLEKE